MDQKSAKVIRSSSPINYSYATIKITQSRIDKGLIAIPVALADWFPDHNEGIQVYLNDLPVSQAKHYSSYTSSARECRIEGLSKWFQQNSIGSGDEIVIQFIDKQRFIYRLIPERNFVSKTQELQHSFDRSKTEQEASGEITTLAQWTHLDEGKVILNEYYRLSTSVPLKERKFISRDTSRGRESTPANVRTLLEDIYEGHCQLCDFWFFKIDTKPYFEIHHLDPAKGHHPKNLIVVCGNCHNQFEYASTSLHFTEDNWLGRVSFNDKIYSVRQAALDMKIERFVKELFI